MNDKLRHALTTNADFLVERMLEECGEGLDGHLEGAEEAFAGGGSGEIADALVEAFVSAIRSRRESIEGMVQYIQEIVQ